ncbi:hypothetical protein T4B_2969 [Trichinella pseudospiralis]|uniref:Uncharacterized protein n=1 Tax=Trichinella pseudospiralis TaxID=6337 RepID=A0A0V1IPN9_TRIPS|nr:hypothetical protein T4B_2969 [Trichinella pseudospiralis]
MVLYHFEKNLPHFELLQSNALPLFDFLSTIQECRISCIRQKKENCKMQENIIFKNLYPAMMTETGHLVGRSINNYSVGRVEVSKTQV